MHELINARTGKEIVFPSQLDELTPEHYLYYLTLYLQQLSGTITDPQEIKRMLFVKLTDLKFSFKMHFYHPMVREQIWSALSEKIDLLDSFFDIEKAGEQNTRYHMHIKCGINLLPEWNGYRGPENMLANLKWGEFIHCLDILKQLQIATTDEDLSQIDLLSVELFEALYKPVKKCRKIKCDEIFDAVLFHCINYFRYIYELITTVEIPYKGNEIPFYIIWQKDEDDDDIKGDLTEWDGILFMLAETGTFGTAEHVNNYNMWEILLYLYKLKFERRQEKLKEKKQNNNGTA